MKNSTKQKLEGKVIEVKGKVKQQVGALSDDPKLEASGVVDQIVGKAKQALGSAASKVGL